MRFSLATILVVGLATEATVASSWFSKPVYNKWHETELERWLSDHDIPFPTAADRKDLENLVKTNWNQAVESPYANWDTDRLQKYMADSGKEVKKGAEQNKDSLVASVKNNWHDTEGTASSSYGSVKDWVFDTWTESSLKAFADKHGIPVPQPRTRDTLLKTVRENYQSAANKAGETAAYPGNWLYSAWSDSDLKSWLDQHGVPAPQPSTRDKLIASVRRNAYVAGKSSSAFIASASKSAAAAQASMGNAIFDAWSDSEIKAWADKNGIKVPQGSNRNELLAIARKNIALLTGDNAYASIKSAYGGASKSGSSLVSGASKSGASAMSVGSNSAKSMGSSASSAGSSMGGKSMSAGSKSAESAFAQGSASAASAYGAATSSAGNMYAKASDDASLKGNELYYQASSFVMSIVTEVQIAVGLKTNYLSSMSKSASSLSAHATATAKSMKNEL